MSSSKKTTRSGRVIKKPLVYSPRMKLDGEMPDMTADEKVLYDELNKVSDSPVRKGVWEKVNELEKFDKRVKYTKDDFDEEDEESSFGEEEHTTSTETVDVVVPTTTETKTPTAPSKKRKREEDDDEDEDYIEEFGEEDDEESDEESDGNESEEDDKIELEERKLDELAKSGELVNPDEADIEDAIPLDKLGEGPPEDNDEESLLDS